MSFLSFAESYSCPFCFKVFNYPEFLVKHLWKSHHYTKDQALDSVKQNCTLPLEYLGKWTKLKNKNRSFVGNNCEICGKLFGHKGDLNKHKR